MSAFVLSITRDNEESIWDKTKKERDLDRVHALVACNTTEIISLAEHRSYNSNEHYSLAMRSLHRHSLISVVACYFVFELELIRGKQDDNTGPPTVETEAGALMGKTESLPLGKAAFEYLGIPYAEPPVGDLRFAEPKPAKPWTGIRDATSYGKACPRPSLPMPISGFEPGQVYISS